jgi:hypothetical protein
MHKVLSCLMVHAADTLLLRLPAVILQEHAVTGCAGQLQFHVEDIFGSSNLTCCCDTCQALAVVL